MGLGELSRVFLRLAVFSLCLTVMIMMENGGFGGFFFLCLRMVGLCGFFLFFFL
ncbi:hypothetical protein B9Z19DRAFT_1079874 [Tuber borchii]|uniref:Uncharacterized protein n=1 Tax=Tuber borchii TaxID=42251 RepID=A0A2T6ZXR2_TUBBO|nr:hypothetical protein B9Z19DRAFT_1079874 [Tuber borchii]